MDDGMDGKGKGRTSRVAIMATYCTPKSRREPRSRLHQRVVSFRSGHHARTEWDPRYMNSCSSTTQLQTHGVGHLLTPEAKKSSWKERKDTHKV